MQKYLLFGLSLILMLSCSKPENKSSKIVIKSDYLWDLASIEADNLDFGLVPEYENKLLTISIQNNTESDITGQISLSHPNFTLLYSNCGNLAVGQKCVAKVSFEAKGELDNYSSNITFGLYSNLLFGAIDRKNDSNIGFYNNNTPISYFDLGNLNYYNMVIKTFKIKNTGNIPLNHSLTTVQNNVSIIYDQCSSKNIHPDKHCVFKILFSGIGKSGLITDTVKYGEYELQLQSNVLNFETLKLASEIELIYNQQLVNDVLDVGTINLGESRPFNFFLKNIGTEAGTVESLTLGNFLEVQNQCSNILLIPNDYCRVKALIIPQIKGVFSNNIIASINQESHDYLIQGVVRTPGDQINCSSQIDFAETANITWNGLSYSNCVVEKCLEYYSLQDNQCNYIMPTAQAISLNTNEDVSLNNQNITFTSITGQAQIEIVSLPLNGTVSLIDGKINYTPHSNFNGVDSFSYRIFDGNEYSLPADVTITIAGVNDAPQSQNLSISTNEDTAVSLSLIGSDVENNSLSYEIVSGPTSGTLSGTAPNLIYTPSLNFNGSDSFTYKVNDGQLDSNVATVSIGVTALNDAPVLSGTNSLSMDINSSSSGNLVLTDVDSSVFTYNIVQGNKGILTINQVSGAITYTPNNNAYGSDSVSITVNDGFLNSNTLNISVNIIGSGIILTADGSRTYFDGTLQKTVIIIKILIPAQKHIQGQRVAEFIKFNQAPKSLMFIVIKIQTEVDGHWR